MKLKESGLRTCRKIGKHQKCFNYTTIRLKGKHQKCFDYTTIRLKGQIECADIQINNQNLEYLLRVLRFKSRLHCETVLSEKMVPPSPLVPPPQLGRSEQPKGHHDAHPRYQVAPPLRPPQMSAPSAPHWAGGVRQPAPAVVPRSRFEPRDAAVRFDPRNRDHLVQAFMAANGGHRQEEYQLAAPNFGADSGNHNAPVVHHDDSAAWHNRL